MPVDIAAAIGRTVEEGRGVARGDPWIAGALRLGDASHGVLWPPARLQRPPGALAAACLSGS
jgi:hypothetical protein